METEDIWKILLPVDGSDASRLAEATAAIVAKKIGATITVLHVIREVEEYYRLLFAAQGLERGVPNNIIKKIINFGEQEANTIIQTAQAQFIKEGIMVNTKLLRGINPAENILEHSKQNYNLIIMGVHGKNEKDPYALGSVTKNVVRHTTCPTLVVKTSCSLLNLLVCIDGSNNSIEALKYAVILADKIGSKIALLNVQEPSLLHLSSQDAGESGERILSKAIEAIRKTEVPIDMRVEIGDISDKIVEVAESGNYDLIILGSRGLGIVKQFLLGSVSDDVGNKAKCSFLIVPGNHE